MSFYPHNFATAEETLGKRESRKLKNNTYLIRRSADEIAVKLHATDVITYHRDGTVMYRSGGYETVTTKDRLNNYGPDGIKVYSDRGTWYVFDYSRGWERANEHRVPFFDGIIFDPSNLVSSTACYRSASEESVRLQEATKKAVASFLRKLTPDVLVSLVSYLYEPGTNGDCFFCRFDELEIKREGRKAACLTNPVDTSTDEEGIPNDHILSHIAEGYWHTTLILCALRWAGYRDEQLPTVIGMHSIVKRAVRRYLMARVGRNNMAGTPVSN